MAATALIATTVASAQDFSRSDPATAEPKARPIFLAPGALADAADLPLEVGGISATTDPLTTAAANGNIDYAVRHSFLGVSVGTHLAPPKVAGLEIDGAILLGIATTTLEEDIHEGSVHEPNPGDQARRNVADDDGDFAYGVWLRGRYAVPGQVRIVGGLDIQYLTGEATFNNARFFGDIVDGDYTFTRLRLTVLGGVRVGLATPYLGLGLLQYDGSFDAREADPTVTTPETWKANFEPTAEFRFLLGVEVQDGRLTGRVEVVLVPELGFAAGFVVRI